MLFNPLLLPPQPTPYVHTRWHYRKKGIRFIMARYSAEWLDLDRREVLKLGNHIPYDARWGQAGVTNR